MKRPEGGGVKAQLALKKNKKKTKKKRETKGKVMKPEEVEEKTKSKRMAQ